MAFIEFSLSVLLFGLDVMLAKKGQSCTLRNSLVVIEPYNLLGLLLYCFISFSLVIYDDCFCKYFAVHVDSL